MPFQLVEKNRRNVGRVEYVSISVGSTRLPLHVVQSIGNYVNVMVDEVSNQIAFRATDDDDANGYVVTNHGNIGCAAIQHAVKRAGKSISPSIQVPIHHDAELNAWVMDLNDAE